MRLDLRNNTVLLAVVVELCIFAVVGLVFLFQYNRAKNEFVTKTRAIAETIGDLSGSFFAEGAMNPTSDEFYHFLDERLGRKKLFNTFEIAPKFFSVVFKDTAQQEQNGGVFMKEVDADKGYSVFNRDGVISVAVPFSIKDTLHSTGIVKIDSETTAIAKKVLSENFLLYAAMLVVFNNQAFILYLLNRRKKEVVFEKGYLRDNSIGALKIMHKILGDVITDHELEEKGIKKDDGTSKSADDKPQNKNVISFSSLSDKKKK
ncbi:MAG: hypothetical protein GWM89_09660 [Candidatus Dadabacteria bacterium]|nr:hypothetical protein [Candidatus Dadabacteria bacterium]NIY22667.1 hypothetical protein [Candidatus Dadabacteria bacterium]